ncbi:MAG: uncharacterized protein JWP01_3612 [Myxococcales bacterium]|nr:uncharacterized protein [Myxococcales bacterium]
MTRAKISALVLVNWKGVFYERYLLDRHVTALEGANGAGKTTVMIAAYVALLPDMSKLRFTNLGETAATGGDRGIWGRLGELGRPSYTVLELDVAGERLLAGVRLLRTSEPTVEPTAFVISKLGPDVRLSDLLLVRRLDGDHVPELEEIRIATERAGGEMQTFRVIKDYFAELFERGISPMRLSGDEERSKLNEMLRTSMTGGISRALTSELRGFLLKEESGLGDTLSRMRANLEACARTRSEVAESRRIEREITAIYESGTEMFAATVHAAREAAAEAERDVERARPMLDDAVRAQREMALSIEQLTSRRGSVELQLVTARAEHTAATADRDRAVAAQGVAGRLADLERELGTLSSAEQQARSRQVAATAERMAARQERARALEAEVRAAHGLADLQAGLDELVRRAHGYRQLARRLDDARRWTERADLAADDAASVIAQLDDERARLEAERARLERTGRDVVARRDEYARARAALREIEPDLTASGDPSSSGGSEVHGRARAALARLAEREALVARGQELERERGQAERLAHRQATARALAAKLALPLADADVGAVVIRELELVEVLLRDLDAAGDARRTEDVAGRLREADLRSRIATLDERIARWQLASTTAARLTAVGGPASTVPTSRADIAALRDRLAAEQHALADRRAQLEARRQELQQRAAAVERSGTNLDPELLRLRDELGAELLASRFEDLDVEAASWVEARLGPLTGALIVDDLDAAAAAVEASERVAPTVWLVGAGATLPVEVPDDLAELADVSDVVVPEPFGVRVTRRLPRPSLGRRARERQVHELHTAIARDGAELDEVAERTAVVAAWRRDVDGFDVESFAFGDPSHERAELTTEIAKLGSAANLRELQVTADRERTTAGRSRLDGLRRLLPDVALLAAPDHAQRASELVALLADRAAITEELVRLASARAVLAEHVDVLRTPPPDDEALRERDVQVTALEARLDQIAVARGALDDVLVHRHAAAFGDAEAALDARAGLAPALEAQHVDARAAVQTAADAEAAAEAAWEVATAAAQQAEAARLAVVAHRDRAAAELASLGTIVEAAASRDLDALAARADDLDRESRELVTQAALAAERLERAGHTVTEARARLAAASRDAGPTIEAWTTLRDRAGAESLLHAVLTGPRTDRTSVQLAADAWSKRELLVDRIARARGGDELVTEIRDHAPDGLGNLATWQAAREWLRRRVPAQVADVDEPLLALERLRDHLDMLEGRLGRQEHDLRGASEDIARGIDVQVRRAHGQVRRLNQQLEGIRFGSIHGIRVEIRRIDRMEQILRALRLGEAQELLFIASIPIEEALDEIFRRYGGGGRGGGQRLLDYREYLELAVEIRRQTSGAWETASPTKLSTGEAIGVGAALMMVVLTEWERDANLLRARRTGGSLRFLFLDEANRLSRDNLGVLFDLCKNLDLQLLIAAPEVARAEGNTTYRLVRHVTDDGREEVIVSGRRAMATAILAAGDASVAVADSDAPAVVTPEA